MKETHRERERERAKEQRASILCSFAKSKCRKENFMFFFGLPSVLFCLFFRGGCGVFE